MVYSGRYAAAVGTAAVMAYAVVVIQPLHNKKRSLHNKRVKSVKIFLNFADII